MPLLQLPTEVGFDHDDPIEASQGNSAENQLESIHPFQIKFSMNPSTAKCSKATPAAVKRDTGKSLALLQACSAAARLSTAIGRGLRGTCTCAQHAWDRPRALRGKTAGRSCGARAAGFKLRNACSSSRTGIHRAQDLPIAPDLGLWRSARHSPIPGIGLGSFSRTREASGSGGGSCEGPGTRDGVPSGNGRGGFPTTVPRGTALSCRR